MSKYQESRIIISFHDFAHVYREYKKKVDGLSNEALSMASGLLQFTEICESEIVGNGSMKLF